MQATEERPLDLLSIQCCFFAPIWPEFRLEHKCLVKKTIFARNEDGPLLDLEYRTGVQNFEVKFAVHNFSVASQKKRMRVKNEPFRCWYLSMKDL